MNLQETLLYPNVTLSMSCVFGVELDISWEVEFLELGCDDKLHIEP